MRLNDGQYECAWCGEVLDLPEYPDPDVVVRASRGEQSIRSLHFDGREIHRCDVGSTRYDWARDIEAITRSLSPSRPRSRVRAV